MRNLSRQIVLNPALFDATGRSAPKLVEVPPCDQRALDRDLAWQRRYDQRLREREWAADERE